MTQNSVASSGSYSISHGKILLLFLLPQSDPYIELRWPHEPEILSFQLSRWSG